MKVLAPVDGSECSNRALRFATEFARRFEASLHVVHVTDEETDATETILQNAREILAEEGIDDDPELSTDVRLEFRPADRVGRDILDLVAERGYDHVVMGHESSGAVERAILGSAAETVLRSEEVAVTVVP
ncbi:universal stress protein [halophilic archaeon]|nr:universal stress protein [halophilic archaeon]